MQSPAEWFVAELKKIGERFEEFPKHMTPMELTKKDCCIYETSDCCHICGELLKKVSQSAIPLSSYWSVNI